MMLNGDDEWCRIVYIPIMKLNCGADLQNGCIVQINVVHVFVDMFDILTM